MAAKQINVMIVEDEKFVRKLICRLLTKEEEINVVAETDDGVEAVVLAGRHKPDAIIMDINIRSLNGIDATRRILDKNPGIKVIALSVLSSKTAIIEMLRAGALGFIPKDGNYEELVNAVFFVMENKYYFSREITAVVHDYFVNSQDSSGRGLLSLTCDDMALVRFSTEGKSLKEMAGILGVSEACVSKRRGRILDKLQINSIAELIELAMREGIVGNNVSSITQGC